jgi:erythritol transport system ATP-binding protein
MNDQVILRAEHITKVYPGTIALADASFNAYAGKVNILVGENGAGKSTLMKIIAGAELPTEGALVLDGQTLQIRSPLDAQKHGIGIIYQDLDLCANMSVSDNIFLTQEIATRGVINFKRQREKTRELLDRLEHTIDPDRLVGDLGVSSQQIVAIAKALLQNVKILIMDEPTSALTANEVSILFRVIRELKSHGVAIVYISHRLEEVMEIGDYITVLRDGKVQAEARIPDINIDWIIEKMVGRALSSYLPSTHHTVSRGTLEVSHLSFPRAEGGFHVRDLSFSVRAGEIVGLYGLMGAGRSELLECLMGLHAEATGDIVVEDKPLRHSMTVDERIDAGLALVPEDRQGAGIVQSMTVGSNITLSNIRDYARMGVLPAKAGLSDVLQMIKNLAIRVSSPAQLVTALSGGTQQKVVVAKSLLTRPRVLLMDEPTRGIDVNAKAEIFGIMNNLAQEGIAILFASSELKEITANSDRVLVMSRGEITGEFTRGSYTDADLVAASAKKAGRWGSVNRDEKARYGAN